MVKSVLPLPVTWTLSGEMAESVERISPSRGWTMQAGAARSLKRSSGFPAVALARRSISRSSSIGRGLSRSKA